MDKKERMWDIAVEADPKRDGNVVRYSDQFTVKGFSENSAKGRARRKILHKHKLKQTEYRTKVTSCSEQKA